MEMSHERYVYPSGQEHKKFEHKPEQEVTLTAIGLDKEMQRRLQEKLLYGMATAILANSKELIHQFAKDLMADQDFLAALRKQAIGYITYEFKEFLHKDCISRDDI
jgi:hypothetical protein